MIYLSWSLVQLVMVLVLLWLPYLVNIKLKLRKVSFKRYLTEWVLCVIFVSFLAFDVGTRQQDLQRNSFDTPTPTERMQKVEREIMGRDDVKENFDKITKEVK